MRLELHRTDVNQCRVTAREGLTFHLNTSNDFITSKTPRQLRDNREVRANIITFFLFSLSGSKAAATQ